MEINVTKENGKARIALVGRLDTVTSVELQKKLDEVNVNNCDLELDFANVEYISSAGLRILLALQKQSKSTNNTMVIMNVNKVVNEIFRVTGFQKTLTII